MAPKSGQNETWNVIWLAIWDSHFYSGSYPATGYKICKDPRPDAGPTPLKFYSDPGMQPNNLVP